MPVKAKEQQQARQREGRKRKARGRREKLKRKNVLTDLHRQPEGHAKAGFLRRASDSYRIEIKQTEFHGSK